MKKNFTLMLLFIIIFTSLSFAEAEAYTATVAKFRITLNGVELKHQSSIYPILVYKNITYFPMTYYYMERLGLDSQFSLKEGLVLTSGNPIRSNYLEPLEGEIHPEKLMLQLPSYKVSINGKVIDNSKEEYPVLNYAGITYFPLTWSFAHDEFNWRLYFDKVNGLTIWTITNIKNILWEDSDYYYFALSYDDASPDTAFLSNHSSLIMKTDKSLSGPWIKCSTEEIAAISNQQPYYTAHFIEDNEKNISLNHEALKAQGIEPVKDFDPTRIELKGNSIYKDGKEAVVLDEYITVNEEYSKNSDEIYSIYVQGGDKLGNELEYTALTVYYNLDIPAPYTSRNNLLLLDFKGKTIVIPHSTLLNRLRFLRDEDGGWYIVELPVKYGRHLYYFGNIHYLSPEGVLTNLEEEIQVQFGIESFFPKLLKVTENGEMYISGYVTDFFYQSKPGNGLFKVKGGTLESIIASTTEYKDFYINESMEIIYINKHNEIKKSELTIDNNQPKH
ncbi:MAG: hypothetical protein ACOZCL_00250 [Bacillota bacterium]